MSYYEIPILLRLVIVIFLFSIFLLIERVLKKERAFRWKGYALWICMAISGMAFGFFLDFVTIHISPEYYRLGKGVAINNPWRTCLDVGGMGGFLAGAVLGGIMLIKNRNTIIQSSSVPWFLLKPVGIILVAATIAAFLGGLSPVLIKSNAYYSSLLGPNVAQSFFRVQQIHASAYSGAFIAFTWLMWR